MSEQLPGGYLIEDDVPLEKSQTNEYKAMDLMRINQSIKFSPDAYAHFTYARTQFHKKTDKRFIIRQIDTNNYRVFRIEDGKALKTYKKKPKKD
jgi:hypothetical protein